MKNGKQKSVKLRNRIWRYFIFFTVLIVFLVWIIQSLFYDFNVIREKTNLMEDYSKFISSQMENDGEINDAYIAVLKSSGVDASVVKQNGNVYNVVFPKQQLVDQANPNYEFVKSLITDLTSNENNSLTNTSLYQKEKLLCHIRKTAFLGGECYLIFTYHLEGFLSNATLLRNQMILSAIIIIIISFFLSWWLATTLSEPICNMSRVAEKWASGDNSVNFEGGGYLELDELSVALNYAKEEVDKSQKLQRDLMANVTHDLKTPLTMIKAYAEMIQDFSGEDKVKRQKHTKVIIDEADRLTSLVNDILNLSKVQSGVETPQIKPFDLSMLTKTVLYRFSAVMQEKGYVIQEQIKNDVFVFGDEKQIEQVIYNLVGNSLNYTGEDKTIKVFLTTTETEATLEIIDSGKGIDKDKVDTIWEKYYRYSETHHRAVKGTGLGLSIVKTILERQNLKFGVISKEGVGSNFYVTFDIAKNVGENDYE